MPRADRSLLGVTDRDENGVAAQNDDGPRAETAMPSHQPVLTEHAFKPGEPRDQQEHHEEQVAAGQACDLADRGCQAARRGERTAGLGGHPEPQRDTESERHHHRDHIGCPVRATPP